MISVRHERPSDVSAREALLNVVFGRDRFEKTSERLRKGRLPAEGLFICGDDGPLRTDPLTCRGRPRRTASDIRGD
jgi:predicted N-acetyltransferase YhbS